MLPPLRGSGRPRRGVTLVEMLVVVALVVLMMTILVQIFQSATGAMTASRSIQELDVTLRQIDSMIRTDLGGVTAKMTPPNDPKNKSGYFTYGENGPADAQGEDTDDYLAFTTKAPEGQVFSGRQWIGSSNQGIQPITITSQVAEVIYFLRNGNLYRRVFLVVPDRASAMNLGQPANVLPATSANNYNYPTPIFGTSTYVSWQGMNDISARPNIVINGVSQISPIPNDLGDLTNRENRAFSPRFVNDFNLDGIPDDFNADGVPDCYQTLYTDGTNGNGGKPNANTFDTAVTRVNPASYDCYAFPFLYPGMYSMPAGATVASGTVTPPSNNYGWRHYTANHSPLENGDNLAAPSSQTWWGFPTWRETMTACGLNQMKNPTNAGGWGDPITGLYTIPTLFQQPLGLRPFAPNKSYPLNSTNFLPPVTQTGSNNPPPYSDGAGSASFVALPAAPNRVWEDDLILTNVRSFDVKAYDADAPLYNTTANGYLSAGYQDLGYGANSFVAGLSVDPTTGKFVGFPFQTVNDADGSSNPPTGFGHEGRIPPLPLDFRTDPRRGYPIGDNSAGVIRLNRVFDTWSTDYTNAPDQDIFLHGNPNSQTPTPIYPAFPPPYPAPLRGIQIQIRLADPRNERSKVLTIRHDFTDKLN